MKTQFAASVSFFSTVKQRDPMNIYDKQLYDDGRILYHLGLVLQQQHEPKTVRPAAAASGPEFRCAWCDAEAGIPKPAHGSNITHGICARHRESFTAEASARNRITS